jgi:bacterioferritin (cytochrome b1)
MLKQDLALEKNALQAYRDAHAVTDDDAPIRFMLEEQIMLEQDDVWEIEKFLSAHKIKVGKKGVERAS